MYRDVDLFEKEGKTMYLVEGSDLWVVLKPGRR